MLEIICLVYLVLVLILGSVSLIFLKNKFKKQIQDSLCEDKSTLDLLKKDYILNYQYVGENQEEIVDIKTDKKICGNSIYDLEILSDVLEKQGMI